MIKPATPTQPTSFKSAQAAWSAAFADLVRRVVPPAPTPEQPEPVDWSITLPGLAKSPLVSSSKDVPPAVKPAPKKSVPKRPKVKPPVETLSARDAAGAAVPMRALCFDVE